jgi:hypothetical protein
MGKSIVMNIQLDFFEDNDDMSILKKEHRALFDRVENMRRGLFARHTDLMKLYIKQQEEIDKLRSMMIKEVK